MASLSRPMRCRLHDLLAGRSTNAAADLRALLAVSARYNLGEAERNFNFPTFPLIYLRPANRSRSKWTVASLDATHVTVRFDERHHPTLVRSQQSADVPARGSCRLERNTFVLEQCTVTVTEERPRGFDRALTYAMVVDFAEDARLAVRVPIEMRDDVVIRFRRSGTEQRVVGVATYRNYRRFETSGRIVGPVESGHEPPAVFACNVRKRLLLRRAKCYSTAPSVLHVRAVRATSIEGL